MTDENVLERKVRGGDPSVDEYIYVPGPEGPVTTTVGGDGNPENAVPASDWQPGRGIKFVANIPQKFSRKVTTQVLVREERELADGQITSRGLEKRVPLYELLKDNPCFMINGVPPRARPHASAKLPTDPDAYRGYAIDWMRRVSDGPTLQSRWEGEQGLRERLGVTPDDLAFIVPFMQGRLLDLGGAKTVLAIPFA